MWCIVFCFSSNIVYVSLCCVVLIHFMLYMLCYVGQEVCGYFVSLYKVPYVDYSVSLVYIVLSGVKFKRIIDSNSNCEQ